MNKRIIRLIIYEGPEELVDLYEERSLKDSRKGGIPNYWIKDKPNFPELHNLVGENRSNYFSRYYK